MSIFRSALFLLLFVLLLAMSRESEAVIYRYVNEKGVPSFNDDLQKVPEQYRAQAVVVSGGNDYDAYTEKEKARLAVEARARQEQQVVAPARNKASVSSRLIRSGIAVGLFAALMFVISNIHGVREKAHALFRIRAGLVLLLLAFLGFTHAKDVVGLFGKAWGTVSSPIASIQDRSAERGRKAAKAYKTLRDLDQRAQDEEARLEETEKKLDDAEQGK